MTSQQILQADVLDILFEKRNKLYGAYSLRKNYSKELGEAIGTTALLVAGLLFLGQPSETKTTRDVSKKEYVVRAVDLQPEKKPELPKSQPPRQAAAPVKEAVYLERIKPVETTTVNVATQEELTVAQPGDREVDGAPAANAQPPVLPSAGNDGGPKTADKEEAVLPSRQPQFPGGTEAWARFLNRYLTPPEELEAGEKRTVLIRFSVDAEGVITNFQVVQSGGTAFDEEVIRVLKKMPRWLPAIQAGKPVAVSFTQPVTFQSE